MRDESTSTAPPTRALRFLFTYEGGLPVVGYGGGHQILRGFAKALTRLGHEVRVVLGGRDEIDAASQDDGVQYIAVGSDSRWRFVEAGAAALRSMARSRPDVVCCFTSELALVAPYCRVRRIPVLTYLADPLLLDVGLSFAGFRNARRHIGQWFQRLGCFAAARVTTISEHTSKQAVDAWGLPACKVVTVGTGLDDSYFASLPSRIERDIGAPLRIVSIGRLALDQKPLDIAARALRQSKIPWSRWTIVGTGADSNELFALIDRLGISDRVEMAGFKTPEEIVAILSCHDIALLPSRRESFFMTPFEAIVRRRLVVTNDVAEVQRRLGRSDLLVLAADCSEAAYCLALSAAWDRLEAGESVASDRAEAVGAQYSWKYVAARLVEVAAEIAASSDCS